MTPILEVHRGQNSLSIVPMAVLAELFHRLKGKTPIMNCPPRLIFLFFDSNLGYFLSKTTLALGFTLILLCVIFV